MGLKENVEAVKKELGAEEQFLESMIKTEGFFKKYKKFLIATGVILVVGFLGYQGYQYTKQEALISSNEAYVVLQNNADDKEALAILRSQNSALYELFIFSQDITSDNLQKLETLKANINDSILHDLVTYQKITLSSNLKELISYAQGQDVLLKDLATIDAAFILFQNDEGEKARGLLSQISSSSSLYQLSQNFSHFQK